VGKVHPYVIARFRQLGLVDYLLAFVLITPIPAHTNRVIGFHGEYDCDDSRRNVPRPLTYIKVSCACPFLRREPSPGYYL